MATGGRGGGGWRMIDPGGRERRGGRWAFCSTCDQKKELIWFLQVLMVFSSTLSHILLTLGSNSREQNIYRTEADGLFRNKQKQQTNKNLCVCGCVSHHEAEII